MYDSWHYEYYLWYLLGSLGTAALYVGAIIGVLTIVATWMVYSKAGEHGWAALVPFYAQYVLYKITWGNGWLFLLLLVPFVNVVVGIITLVKLSKSFGYGGGFACGLIFLNTIFMLILGFGSSRYVGPGGVNAGWREDFRDDYYAGGQRRYDRGTDYDVSSSYASSERAADEADYGNHSSADYDYGGYRRTDSTRCPDCGAAISGSGKYCPYCGAKLR